LRAARIRQTQLRISSVTQAQKSASVAVQRAAVAIRPDTPVPVESPAERVFGLSGKIGRMRNAANGMQGNRWGYGLQSSRHSTLTVLTRRLGIKRLS
jgi:hypothetical protein